MSESSGKRPGWVPWAGLAMPVILACAVGWGMQQDISIQYMLPFLLILLLAMSVAFYFFLKATKPQELDEEDETSSLS